MRNYKKFFLEKESVKKKKSMGSTCPNMDYSILQTFLPSPVFNRFFLVYGEVVSPQLQNSAVVNQFVSREELAATEPSISTSKVSTLF